MMNEKIDEENFCQVISHFYYASLNVHRPFQTIIHFKVSKKLMITSSGPGEKHEILL